MARPRKQHRIARFTPLRELRPAPANPLIYPPISAPAPQVPPAPAPQVSQLISYRQNNEPGGHLTPTALEEEYAEHSYAEATFPPDLDDNDIQSSLLRYQSHMDSVVEGLKCICGCYGLFIFA